MGGWGRQSLLSNPPTGGHGRLSTAANYPELMARLRLFAQAREAAGTKQWDAPAATVGDLLDAAVGEFGPDFARVLPHCRIWVDGEPAERCTPVADHQEVAVLPPVSGG